VRFPGNQLALLLGGKRVRTGIDIAFFNALQETGDTDLKKFIEIAGRNSQELYALQQRIPVIVRFFKHATVEGEP
jgi:hypothetical protein